MTLISRASLKAKSLEPTGYDLESEENVKKKIGVIGGSEMLFQGSLLPKAENGKSCRTCTHRQRWETGGRITQYCGKLTSNRTHNGKKKILSSDEACCNYHES